ncbi:Heat shock protein, putative isoform 1 [Hibiscus syriacus]|uniref:Heat shock protein, putative isoform 1 n=1 Tax=Hibiscus syriacus TaxID=106335 RepID=A0A6A2Z8R1_HIBSY|nr:Heat shock protein, putative isoform 1 [Hibiscus syriacus]
MDESPRLVRSFSNPLQVSREVKEGDPIHDAVRVLTESISFGRFVSESLSWEKWSTFSHNRYLEEVEKFSKPGSVAQMKAFFEAHYKRRAAMRAAALLEQADIVTNDASQIGTINTDLADLGTSLAVNQPEKDASDDEIADNAGVDAGNLNVVRENDVADMEQGPKMMEEDVNMEECQQVENSKTFENGDIHDKIVATPTIPPKKCDDPKTSTSSSKNRTNSLSKSLLPGKASNSPVPPSKRMASGQDRNDADVAKSIGNSYDKKKTMPNLFHMSLNLASSAGKTNRSVRMSRDIATHPQMPTRVLKKTTDQVNLATSSENKLANSNSKLSDHGGVYKQATSRVENKSNNHAYINKKPALDSNEQRRITIKSLHMSMDFTRRAGEATKTSPKVSKESSTPLQTPTRFFKKLEEKMQAKEAEKSQIQIKSKEKAKDDMTKLRQRTDAKLNQTKIHAMDHRSSTVTLTSLTSGLNFCSLCFEIDLKLALSYIIPSTRPQSPKLGRKPSNRTVQSANSRPPTRPSVSTESSKNGLMKNSRISGTALPKNRHENASPNIQLSVGKPGIPCKHENG